MSSLCAYVRDLTYAAMSGVRPAPHATHGQPMQGCLACALTQLAPQLTPQTQGALAADQTGARAKAPTTEGDQGHDRA